MIEADQVRTTDERLVRICSSAERVDVPISLTWNGVLTVLEGSSPVALSNREITIRLFGEDYKYAIQTEVCHLTRIMFKAGKIYRVTGAENHGKTPGIVGASKTYHYTVFPRSSG